MERTAGSALSSRVVRVDAQARPEDLAEKLAQDRATHAAVFEAGVCRGVVPVREALRSAPGQTFGELLPASSPEGITGELSLDAGARLLAESESDALPVRDHSGKYIGTVMRQSLLEELLREKERLAESDARLRTVLDNVPAVISQFDRDGRHVYVNRSATEIKVQDILGRHITEVVPPEFRSELRLHLDRVMETRESVRFEFPGFGPNGTTVLYAGRLAPLVQNGEPSGFITVVTDSTESGKFEQALRQSEQRLQQVINSAPVVLFATDRNGTFTVSEGQALKALGLRPGEAVGKSAFDRYRDNPTIAGSIRRALSGEEFTAIGEIRGRAYECRCTPTFAPDGEISGMIGVATDITERRRAEMALRQSEQHLQQVINSAPVLLFATDRRGVYTLSEGKAVRAFGARPGDAVGTSAFDRYRDIPIITESIGRALAGEEFTAVAEIRSRTFECRCAPTRGADGEVSGMIGVATDITERRQAERQTRRLLDELAQTARISTMGEMASGLAHELNQPLAAIVAYVDACQELVESGRMSAQQLTEVLRSVSGQAERAGQIIHRLRKMIRRSQPVRASMSVNDAVREVAVLLDTEARQAGVTIELVLREDLPDIAADFLQIQQVIQNLMRNGLEAMTDVPSDQRGLKITTEGSAASGVEIAVSDGGRGLAGAAAEQVFEPFFTTKTGGLGLGLSISRTIVEAHGGQIWMTANSPHGITARLRLPTGGGKAAP